MEKKTKKSFMSSVKFLMSCLPQEKAEEGRFSTKVMTLRRSNCFIQKKLLLTFVEAI